ncbi:MAG: membrane protein insertion efficiency factor YidD [Thermotogota bacterium]|nr:membrane protein insertion efficiency factor YidD [Thermotogota bacterium]
MVSNLIIFAIKFHQKIISPILNRMGIRCRFYPTCSQYSIIAIKKYGLLIGVKKTYLRIKKCRPDNFDSCIDFP